MPQNWHLGSFANVLAMNRCHDVRKLSTAMQSTYLSHEPVRSDDAASASASASPADLGTNDNRSERCQGYREHAATPPNRENSWRKALEKLRTVRATISKLWQKRPWLIERTSTCRMTSRTTGSLLARTPVAMCFILSLSLVQSCRLQRDLQRHDRVLLVRWPGR